MTNLRLCIALCLLACLSHGFSPLPHRMTRKSATRLHVDLTDPSIVQTMQESRIAFFIWFFGASGAAGIARSAFPRMYKSTRYIRELKGKGPTEGGEALGISPLCMYPEDLRIADVMTVVNSSLTVEEIIQNYPVEDSFFSKRGYLTFPAFQSFNADKNPLAVRAIFDTFAQSTDTCTPSVAQEKLNSYMMDVQAVKPALLKSKAVGYFAVFVLLGLLGMADFVAAGHAYHGWFPDWPGGANFPSSVWSAEGALGKIPNYWIGDLPE